ncbi:centromere protein Q-like [Haliotis cracherodii]|uniref:centromere protein Q-like n=1 Tax=Haliotis cracherodii TaxID=6455 RepID=UPI0039ECC6F2
MARLKVTPRKKKHVVTKKTSSESEAQSGPSRKSIQGRRQSTLPLAGRRQRLQKGLGEMTATSTDTNERESRSVPVRLRVAPKSLKAWKPLRTSTKKYALQLYDTVVEMLLSRTSDNVLGDVQRHLSHGRRKFADKLEKSTGPVNNITNYNNLHKLLNSQEEADVKMEETLQGQIEEEERKCRDIEEEMETCKLYAGGASQLHPLLQS